MEVHRCASIVKGDSSQSSEPKMASRVIVCKLGRLGELRKILDRTTAQTVNPGDKDDNGKRRRRNFAPSLAAAAAAATTTAAGSTCKGQKTGGDGGGGGGPGGGGAEVGVTSTHQLRSEGGVSGKGGGCAVVTHLGTIASEVQVLNAEGGLYLGEDVRDAIFDLGIGETVSGARVDVAHVDVDVDAPLAVSRVAAAAAWLETHISALNKFI